MSTAFRLLVPAALFAEMVAQAESERPNECCGLLAGTVEGDVGRVRARYPLVNAAASPTRFVSEPRGLFEASRAIDRGGFDLLAVYHSHPTTAAVPSRIDLEWNYSADVVTVIVSLSERVPQVRAWWLSATGFREAEWAVE